MQLYIILYLNGQLLNSTSKLREEKMREDEINMVDEITELGSANYGCFRR